MKNRNRQTGFTLIELLTVVAIISMLVALLSVAQKKVKMVSKNLRQKAVFHGGEISLALFQNDFGDYPESDLITENGTSVTGSQRVAEALFGRDDRGFNPKTKWHPDLDPADLYHEDTMKDRKTPYFERKHSGFYTIYELWQGNKGSSSIYDCGTFTPADQTLRSPIFTDVFTRNKIKDAAGDTIKVGMPILYFKAHPTKRFRVDDTKQPVNPAVQTEYKDWVYNFEDNFPLLQLPWLRDQTTEPDGLNIHYFRDDNKDGTNDAGTNAQVFYELITQRADTNINYYKPYNQNTYLMISAGWDGIFGTKDDLTNFDD